MKRDESGNWPPCTVAVTEYEGAPNEDLHILCEREQPIYTVHIVLSMAQVEAIADLMTEAPRVWDMDPYLDKLRSDFTSMVDRMLE